MLKLFKRFISIFKSIGFSIADEIENPSMMLNLGIEELSESIDKITNSLAKTMANEKDLFKKYEQAKLSAENWEQKAIFALEKGNDELSKKALAEKVTEEQQAEQFWLLSNHTKQTVVKLTEQLEGLKVKLQECKIKKNILTAQYNTAKANMDIAKQIGGINGEGVGNFSKYEDKINQLTHEADAMNELVNKENQLERDFKQLEKDHNVNKEFEKLKLKLQQNNSGSSIEYYNNQNINLAPNTKLVENKTLRLN